MNAPAAINTIEEFLAHARALENESVDRYEELADVMEVHNNPEVAELFSKLAGYGRQHAAEVERLAAGMALPHIDPWDFKWIDGQGPESSDHPAPSLSFLPKQTYRYHYQQTERHPRWL